jgi:putative aldouronate transport system permease protein
MLQRSKTRPQQQLSLGQRLLRDRVLLLFALPGTALIIAFHYVPLLGNVIAFKDYQPFLGISGSDWSGWANFGVIFNGDPAFLRALKNTLILTSLQSIFVFPAPILYLPHFMSWVIVVALFQQMLGGSGLLNNYLRSHDLATINIIGNSELFHVLLTSQIIWKDTGWATILFLAALSQIDSQLYEAASVDGASRMRQLWHVTLPGLRGIIILLFILRLGDSLTVGFEQIILQQQAVGRDISEVLDTYVYNNGVIGGAWGVAAAVGLVKGLVGVALVLAANKVAHIFGEQGVYQR